ncbi:MAG: hypothetical protein NVSMB46_01210 [Candidatus Saccharimonadales bacterium]
MNTINNEKLMPNEMIGVGSSPTNIPAYKNDDTVKQQPIITSSSGVTASKTSQLSSLIADDTDLIEKEWVVKAKEIIAKTSENPYSQNNEMNKIKADYLKKRYNKDLKLNED